MIGSLFVTAFIADIHFGVKDSERLYNELTTNFLNVLKNKRIDLVVIGGDTFHNVVSMNTVTSRYVLLFMKKLIRICKKNDIKYIRVIQGTMSHDNNQLNVFKMYENDPELDFKLVMTLTEETFLQEKMKVLYVPEEYLLSSKHEEYYGNYLYKRKYYDMIFGHGMFNEAMYIPKQESEIDMSSAPIFDSKVFISACNGPIYFGHIHRRMTIRDHIHYPGSFSRFSHNEEADKGWYLNVYDTETSKYIHEFIINDLAPKYITKEIQMDEFDDFYNNVLKKPVTWKFDYLKMRILIPKKKDKEFVTKQTIIRDLCSDYKNIKVEFMTEKDKYNSVKYNIMKQAKENGYMEGGYTTFEGLMEYLYGDTKECSHEEKIQKFIKKKYKKNVPIDVIKDVLNLL